MALVISLTDFEPLDSSQSRYQWHIDLFLLSSFVIPKYYRFVLNMAGFTSWEMINAEELQDYVEENGVSRVDEYVSGRLDDWRNVVVHFAVCGVSGSGKSTFINLAYDIFLHILLGTSMEQLECLDLSYCCHSRSFYCTSVILFCCP